MAKNFRQLVERIEQDPKRRARMAVDERAMRDALALAELRERCSVTQKEVATALDMSKANVSRIEHEEDPYLSTLRRYVAVLGGRLDLTAVFPELTVQLTPHATNDEG